MDTINRLIAEEIFGWEYRHDEITDPIPSYYQFTRIFQDEGLSKGVFCNFAPSWQPSVKIREAFMVVEKMRKKGFAFEMYWHTNRCGEPRPQALFYFVPDNALEYYYAVADTPAMAICLAALKAIRGEASCL